MLDERDEWRLKAEILHILIVEKATPLIPAADKLMGDR